MKYSEVQELVTRTQELAVRDAFHNMARLMLYVQGYASAGTDEWKARYLGRMYALAHKLAEGDVYPEDIKSLLELSLNAHIFGDRKFLSS